MIKVKFLTERDFGGVHYFEDDEVELANDIGVERLVEAGDVAIISTEVILTPQNVTQTLGNTSP